MNTSTFYALITAGLTWLFSCGAMAKPLQVFILAGQSNMQGHAKVSTFDHMAADPRTAPILQEMRAADGTPRVCDQVWISALGVSAEERHGPLTATYGAAHSDAKIGPEYTFGIYMQKLLHEPILIIKTAWGGKSLHTDFRPPSADTYPLNDFQKDLYAKRGWDVEEKQAEVDKASGHSYRLMMDHVRHVLNDVKRVYPAYDSNQGYDLAGFVWFQGWNDMVDGQVYPHRKMAGGYDLYSELLAHFIRDVRKDLSAPDMPFVIGVMGVGGIKDGPDYFREAMAAPASLPEFLGNVAVVRTEVYWDPELGELDERWNQVRNKSRALNKDDSLSPAERTQALNTFVAERFTPEELNLRETAMSNAGYHYLGSAKILAQIGKAFAEALYAMQDSATTNGGASLPGDYNARTLIAR